MVCTEKSATRLQRFLQTGPTVCYATDLRRRSAIGFQSVDACSFAEPEVDTKIALRDVAAPASDLIDLRE